MARNYFECYRVDNQLGMLNNHISMELKLQWGDTVNKQYFQLNIRLLDMSRTYLLMHCIQYHNHNLYTPPLQFPL